MILGTGVDIVEIGRIAKAAENERFLDKLFAPDELKIFKAGKYRMETVAGRFAAKEAVLKALGCGLSDIPMRDIAVTRAPSGQPMIALTGIARQKAEQCGVSRVHISISHSERYAVACAIAEGDLP